MRAGIGKSAIPKRNELWVVLFASGLLVALWVLYRSAFDAPFYFDSVTHLKNKTNLHMATVSWSTVLDAMRFDFRKPAIYRPLSQLTLAFTHLWFGLAPRAYRIGNLLIHWAASLALVFLLLSVLRAPRIAKASPSVVASALPLALALAAIWSLHPVQTNVATYVIQRAASMAGLFGFLSVGAYIRARCAAHGWSWPWGAGALAAFVLGVASKENAVTVLPALLVCEAVLLEPPDSLGVRRGLTAVWGLLLLAIIGGLLFEHRVLLNHFSFARRPFTRMERLLTEARIQGDYLRLLAFPRASLLILTPDVAASKSLLQPASTGVAVGMILASLGLALACIRRFPLLSFGVLWYFAHQLVESTILPLEIYYEHRLYIPSMAVFLLLALGLWGLVKNTRKARIACACLLAISLGAEAWGTYTRNEVWSEPVAFWSDALRKAPRSARVHTNLGIALLASGDVEAGERILREALALDGSKRWVIHLQLARAAYLKGNRDQAREHLQASLEEVRRSNWEAPLRLGLLALEEGRFEEARRYLGQSMEQRAGNPEAWRLLGVVQMQTGDLAGAEESVRTALRFDPRHAESWNTLGAIYFAGEEYRKAEEEFLRALSIDGSNKSYRKNLEAARARLLQ